MLRFEYQFDENYPKVLVEMSSESNLSDIVQQFEGFLKAAGYSFAGHLDFIDDEEDINVNA